MKKSMMMVLGLLALMLVFLPQTAMAQIDSVLGDIQWGDSPSEVVEKLRASALAELQDDARLRNDRVAMQRARQRTLDQMRRIEDSLTPLRGERTGFEVSVVGGEFTSDNNESLLRVRDDIAQRYYFFVDDGLYKLVVAYDQDYIANVGFETFLSQATQRYGEPSATEYGRVRGEHVLAQASWRDGRSSLEINDRREFFGTFTMTFADLRTINRLTQENRAVGGSQTDDSEVSDRVRALTDMSATDPNADVVDSLIGSVEVELPDRPSAREDEEDTTSSSATSSRTVEEERPRQQRRRAPRRTSDDDDDGELVIY